MRVNGIPPRPGTCAERFRNPERSAAKRGAVRRTGLSTHPAPQIGNRIDSGLPANPTRTHARVPEAQSKPLTEGIAGFSGFERGRVSIHNTPSRRVGAWGRNRTGTGLPPRDFLTHYSFRCCACPLRRIWSLDFIFALSAPGRCGDDLGRGRQVSTLSPIRLPRPGLSSVLQPPFRAAVPPNLTPFTQSFPG